ncbi:MAG: ATP-binding cassette domain-containing protein [Candidatus Uhrbacteria bacterium]|nr:ATP-binding cassette domain-containing protein [Candidatus Uhrbacteria bacterium]
MRPLLEIQKLCKKYGNRVIFDDAGIVISDEQKTGVIGRNGAGKSTLFKMILGQEEIDSGTIRHMPGVRLGYVEQHAEFPPEETVIGFLIRTTGKEEWECAKMAGQFQLKRDLLTTPAANLSGGYRMRVKLVAMLLADPNLLLLDEPTNYLDLATLLLLERLLRNYRGSMLVISHDREFLERTCTSTLEVDDGTLTYFPGDVESYLAYKEEQLAFKEKANKKILAQKAHLQEFVDRFRYKASKASQAQSKMKAIARLHTIAIKGAASTARIVLPKVESKQGSVLRVERLAIGYGTKTVADTITFEIPRGEHVVILGNNGQGKTTLLKTLANELAPIDGKIAWWHRADIGYYAQHVEAALNPTDRVDGYLRRQAPPGSKEEEVLRMAGNFLFRRDDLEKTVSMLSGGEKARLCLAGILLHNHNVLILDEPTNHLDFETAETLAEALASYGGTVLFVSHSRTFVNAVSTKILEVRDGTVRQYPNTYEDYVANLEEVLDADVGGEIKVSKAPGADEAERLRFRMELKELTRQAALFEKRIAAADKRKSELLQYFFDNPTDYAPDKATELKTLSEQIQKDEDQWMTLLEKIETMRAKPASTDA